MGLDPGLRHTGWAVAQTDGYRFHPLAHGVIHPPTTGSPMAERLAELYKSLLILCEKYAPDEVAVEEVFVNKNPSSSLKLGMARGVVIAVPSILGIPVFEYTANQVKKALVGSGHASKDQISFMLKALFPNYLDKLTADAADALAVAFCHDRCRTFLKTSQ